MSGPDDPFAILLDIKIQPIVGTIIYDYLGLQILIDSTPEMSGDLSSFLLDFQLMDLNDVLDPNTILDFSKQFYIDAIVGPWHQKYDWTTTPRYWELYPHDDNFVINLRSNETSDFGMNWNIIGEESPNLPRQIELLIALPLNEQVKSMSLGKAIRIKSGVAVETPNLDAIEAPNTYTYITPPDVNILIGNDNLSWSKLADILTDELFSNDCLYNPILTSDGWKKIWEPNPLFPLEPLYPY